MFSTTKIINKTVNINEHRAPTDDSVRLLREMEQKANDNVLKSTKVDNNSFNAVLHQMRDHLSDFDKYAVIFSINGKKMQVFHNANSWDKKEETLISIRDKLAIEISTQILVDLFKNRKLEC